MPEVEVIPTIGVRYEVAISDCCVARVEFTATVTAIETVDSDPGDVPMEPALWGLTFDNGVVIDAGFNAGVNLKVAS